MSKEEVAEQATSLEGKITGRAEAFNEAASKMTAAQSQVAPAQPAPTEPVQSEAQPQPEAPQRQSRRQGRRGHELTLPD